MVTRSDRDWEGHKREVLELIRHKYGEDKASKFIEMYKDRYDKHNRNLIDYKLAFSLTNDYYHVKRHGTKWYAVVGTGGTGKTTILKNIMYYLDPSFKLDRLHTEILPFIKQLNVWERADTLHSIMLDEPDDDYSANSRGGKLLRKIFGKIRQQNLFIGICATDLKDIPPYIYRKLDTIIFCPFKRRAMVFKNKPKKKSYVVQKIRDEYAKKGYDVFFELQRSKGCTLVNTYNLKPFTVDEEKEYDALKHKDYKKNTENFVSSADDDEAKPALNPDRQKVIDNIIQLSDEGLNHTSIAAKLGYSRQNVSYLLQKYRKTSKIA